MTPDLFTLIEACCSAYDNPSFKPRGGVTFCNQAVQFIASEMGYKGFKPTLNANAMIIYMMGAAEWLPVEMGSAQRLANTGVLVIACQQAQPHGHVAVIRPGVEGRSAKWKNALTPKVMNIGGENSIAKGVNFVFEDIPKFFALETH